MRVINPRFYRFIVHSKSFLKTFGSVVGGHDVKMFMKLPSILTIAKSCVLNKLLDFCSVVGIQRNYNRIFILLSHLHDELIGRFLYVAIRSQIGTTYFLEFSGLNNQLSFTINLRSLPIVSYAVRKYFNEEVARTSYRSDDLIRSL